MGGRWMNKLHGPCREFGCMRVPAYIATGYCLNHHGQRFIRGAAPRHIALTNLAFKGSCREPPCVRIACGVHGYCPEHYGARIRIGHKPLRPSAAVGPKCRLPYCAKACGSGAGYGLCGAHYRRLNRMYPDPDMRRWAAGIAEQVL
jgi:hypothetical protein